MIFAEGDPATRADNFWVHANVNGVTFGSDCGGAPSVNVSLNQVSPVNGLSAVGAGAPLRGYELQEVFTYNDTDGDLWIGVRRYGKASGWGLTQPLLGPLAASGLQFTYFDAAGVATAVPAEVARVGVTVIGQTMQPVRASDGTVRHVVDTLTTFVALRNN